LSTWIAFLLAAGALELAPACAPAAVGYAESPSIFGIHEPGGEGPMAAAGRKGWIQWRGQSAWIWSGLATPITLP
jgi:hypothetical protein